MPLFFPDIYQALHFNAFFLTLLEPANGNTVQAHCNNSCTGYYWRAQHERMVIVMTRVKGSTLDVLAASLQ